MDIDILIFFKRIYGLLRSFPFWMMTFLCNVVVFISSLIFYGLEKPGNSNVNHYIDAVWWSFSTITTVGYGDITPVSFWGKILGIILMIVGTGLFVSYTALFANAMLGREFTRLGRRVKMIGRNVQGIQEDLHEEELSLERQINSLNSTLARLESRLDDIEKRDIKR
jgi:voltage-gated potassium channel